MTQQEADHVVFVVWFLPTEAKGPTWLYLGIQERSTAKGRPSHLHVQAYTCNALGPCANTEAAHEAFAPMREAAAKPLSAEFSFTDYGPGVGRNTLRPENVGGKASISRRAFVDTEIYPRLETLVELFAEAWRRENWVVQRPHALRGRGPVGKSTPTSSGAFRP